MALDSLVETAPGSYEAYYALVRDTLLSGGPPPVDPADSLVVLLVIEAAQQSARTGQVVRLDT